MPSHDFRPRPPRRDVGGRSFTPGMAWLAWIDALAKRRRRRKDDDEGGVPARPDRPSTLSGGAAEALDFEGEGKK